MKRTTPAQIEHLLALTHAMVEESRRMTLEAMRAAAETRAVVERARRAWSEAQQAVGRMHQR